MAQGRRDFQGHGKVGACSRALGEAMRKAFSSRGLHSDQSVPFGTNWCNNPLACSFVARSDGL